MHTVNMYDCIFKDYTNNYSIDGLYEVIEKENIGDKKFLDRIKNDSNYYTIYRELRKIRNHSVGHIDSRMTLDNILDELYGYDLQKVFDFRNQLDSAVKKTAETHFAINSRYLANTSEIRDPNIVEIKGLANVPYFDE